MPFLLPFNFTNISRFGHFLRLVGQENGSNYFNSFPVGWFK
jgi:hypothetical protein